MSAKRDVVGVLTLLAWLLLLALMIGGVQLPSVDFLGQPTPAWSVGLLVCLSATGFVLLWPVQP